MLKIIKFHTKEKKSHFSISDKENDGTATVGSVLNKGDKIIITQELIDNLQAILDKDFKKITEEA